MFVESHRGAARGSAIEALATDAGATITPRAELPDEAPPVRTGRLGIVPDPSLGMLEWDGLDLRP